MRFFGGVFDFGLGDSAVCVDGELILFDELPRFGEIRGHFRRIEYADDTGTLLRNAARHNQNFLPNCLKPENFNEYSDRITILGLFCSASMAACFAFSAAAAFSFAFAAAFNSSIYFLSIAILGYLSAEKSLAD